MIKKIARLDPRPRKWTFVHLFDDSPFFTDCPRCGSTVEAFCDGQFEHGTNLRCPRCGLEGMICFDEKDQPCPEWTEFYESPKEWRHWPQSNEVCPKCKSPLKVFTEKKLGPGLVSEGSVVRCFSNSCPTVGATAIHNVAGDYFAYVDWFFIYRSLT